MIEKKTRPVAITVSQMKNIARIAEWSFPFRRWLTGHLASKRGGESFPPISLAFP